MSGKREEVQAVTLSEKQKEEMAHKVYDKLFLEFTNNVLITKKIDKTEMNKYINELYEVCGYGVPKIIYLNAPTTSILSVSVLSNAGLLDVTRINNKHSYLMNKIDIFSVLQIIKRNFGENEPSEAGYNFKSKYKQFGEETWNGLNEHFDIYELKKAKNRIDKIVESNGNKYNWFLDFCLLFQYGFYQLYLPLFKKFILELYDDKIVDDVGFDITPEIRKEVNSLYYIHSSCFMWGAFEKVCIVCEFPDNINKDFIEFSNGERIRTDDNLRKLLDSLK